MSNFQAQQMWRNLQAKWEYLFKEPNLPIVTESSLTNAIGRILRGKNRMQFADAHTHIFPPGSGGLFLCGLHEMMKYHYVQREFLRARRDITPDEFFVMSDIERTRMVWKTFFGRSRQAEIGFSPNSEGMRAVLTLLNAFNLDVNAPSPDEAIGFFEEKAKDQHGYFEEILKMAGISTVVGTNDPFAIQTEIPFYRTFLSHSWHPAMKAALRLDTLVLKPEEAMGILKNSLGFSSLVPSEGFTDNNVMQLKQFVGDWLSGKPQGFYLPEPLYVGCSFPPDFCWIPSPENIRLRMLEEVVIPMCSELGKPLFLMLGPIRQVNPAMKNAGDTMGKVDLTGFPEFLARHQEIDLFITTLDPSAQAQFNAYSCALPHVIVWSCWWFQHQPGRINSLTNDRFDTLGDQFYPFNSDARVLEHLLTKWEHWRRDSDEVLVRYWKRSLDAGRRFTENDIRLAFSTQFDLRRLNRDKWMKLIQATFT